MYNISYTIMTAFLFLSGIRVGFQQGEPTATPPPINIASPLPGQALQGIVPIVINTNMEGFQSAELTFAYLDDATDTWFLIYESEQPVLDGELTQWDTTTLTDGEYSLRLVLTLQDESQVSAVVPDLRVRNYTAVETDTPIPTETPALGDTPIPTNTPTSTRPPIPPTGTPLPPNPAQLTNQDITLSLGKGALGAFGAFAIIGLYAFIRNILRI